MKATRAKIGLVLQGYFRIERFQRTANRAAVAQPRGRARPTPRVPRPDLLPAKMRGGPAQAKLEGTADGAWSGAPRPELLPGMGPARVGRPQRTAQAQPRNAVSTTPIPAGQLRIIGEGRPLEAGIRQTMESFFQADFSGVRVHEGPTARAMGALAFTLGDALHFAPGLYDPASRDGLALLGHELTHVVQQRDGRVANPYGQGVAIVQDPALEAEADRMGQQIADEVWSGQRAGQPRVAIGRLRAPANSPAVRPRPVAIQPAWAGPASPIRGRPGRPSANRQERQRTVDAARRPRVAQASTKSLFSEKTTEVTLDVAGCIDSWLQSKDGLPTFDSLPDSLTIDPELQQLFSKAYFASIEKGLEYGAILGFPSDFDAKAELHPGALVTGTSDGVTTENGKSPEGTSAVGSFHTHPHGKEEGEFAGGDSPHSSADILQLAKSGHIVSFVASGGHGKSVSLYVIVNTIEFDKGAKQLLQDVEKFEKLFKYEIGKLYQQGCKENVEQVGVVGDTRFVMAAAYNVAIVKFAKDLKFGFYNGSLSKGSLVGALVRRG